jgi:hypothetical protein
VFVYDTLTGAFAHTARISHHPGWRRNGEDILYVGRNPATGIQDLRLVRHDGTNDRPIFDAEHLPAGHPSFHPRSDDLLVTDCFGGRQGYGIALIDLRANRLRLLASMPLGEDPMAAPAARAADPPCWHTWSYPRWRSHAHPCWNADGSAVLYNDLSSGTAQLSLVDTSDLVL